jgi:hypothetical protein
MNPDREIMMAEKMYYENDFGGTEFVTLSGILTGEDLGYPNNSHAVTCWSDRKECYVSSIEQIGPNQIGRLDGPYSYPVVKWTATQVVARDDATTLGCSRTTITIDRTSRALLWVEEPINQMQPNCKDAATTIRKYSLEDSPGVKKLRAAVSK